MNNKELIIAIGNIGTGKSLIARKYALRGYQVVNRDSLEIMLDGGECGHLQVLPRHLYASIEKAVLHELFETECPVFLNRTCINHTAREKYLTMAKEYGYKAIAIDFGPGGKATLQRRIEDNKSIPIEVWERVHKHFKTLYKPADPKEGFDEIIEAPKRFRFYAFDFDGTMVENEFPHIGKQRPEIVERIRKLYADNRNIIIIWTCRDNNALLQMRDYLILKRIPYDFINENPLFKTNSPKIFAHEYYDDHSAPIG